MSYNPLPTLGQKLSAGSLPAVLSSEQETILSTIASNSGQAVMSVTNVLSVTAHNLLSSAYSGVTAITSDAKIANIDFKFTTAESKTITITHANGTVLFARTTTATSLSVPHLKGFAINANENLTIAITQTAGACSVSFDVFTEKGSNTLVGNPNVQNQYYDVETSAWTNMQGADGATRIMQYTEAIAMGQINGHTSLRCFGQRTALSVATGGDDIWEGTATTCPIPPTAGDLMSVVSTSAQDGVAGTGVLTLDIHYIDPTGNPQITVITMNGTTAVNTGILMRFIQSIHTETVGSTTTAVGTISIYKTGTPATVYNVITPGGNMSLNMARMIPLGKTFYMTNLSVAGSSNKAISVKLRSTSTFEDVLTTGTFFLFKDATFIQNSTREKQFRVPLKFPALCVIKATAYSAQAGGDVSFSIDGWYE